MDGKQPFPNLPTPMKESLGTHEKSPSPYHRVENLHLLSATTENSSGSKEAEVHDKTGHDGPIYGHQGGTPRLRFIFQNG